MAATNHAQAIKQDSRTYLATALLQLLATHDLNTITVTQVVKRAGVSRMAFYRNFDTLDDVLLGYFRPAMAAQFKNVLAGVSTADKLVAMGQFFTHFADPMRLATQRGFEHVIRQVFDENMIHYYQQSLSNTTISAINQRYWTKFMSAGVYAIWREWLMNGQQESLTTIHELIAALQQSTMAALTKNAK